MTLREEVLKNSGLLTEEILEEGKLGRAVAIAAMIAALAFSGFKGAQTVKDYKIKSSVSASTKYDIADHKSSTAKSLLKISTDYSKNTKLSILNLDVNADYGLGVAKKHMDESGKSTVDVNDFHKIIVKDYIPTVLSSLDNYVKNLESQNNKLEKTLSKSTYASSKPIYININITYDKDYNNFSGTSTFLALLRRDLAEDVASFFNIDERLVDIFVNGKRDI